MSVEPMTPRKWNAAEYDQKHSFVWQYGQDVVRLLNPQPGERTLDLGSGTGHLTAAIAASGADVLGIDASAEMIARARAAYPDLRFEQMNALEMAFDREFDAVFSNATIHWIRPPEKLAERIFAALKPGGRLVAEFGGKGNVGGIIGALTESIREAGLPVPEVANYYPSPGEYASLLESAGFMVSSLSYFDRPTKLEGGENGIHDWLNTFVGRYLEGIPESARPPILARVEERLRPILYRDGAWYADYRRLRIVARRPVDS